MILQSLSELYTRLAQDPSYELAPPGFSPQKISYRVILKLDGTLFDIEDARTLDEKSKLQNTIMLVPGNGKRSGKGAKPHFLWDSQTYLLGKQPDDKDPGTGATQFEAFRKRHIDCERDIDDEEFSAVCKFLNQWIPEKVAEFPILESVGTGFGIFQIQGNKKPVHENPAIQKWWRMTQEKVEPSDTGQCLLSGNTEPIARLHPMIKGVTGAQSSGASIVSFNAAAYESYGKSQSYNAPVSEDAAFQYGTALNSLLTGPQSSKHRIRIGDTTAVFWTEKPTLAENIFANVFSSGSNAANDVQDAAKRDQIKRLLEAIRSGGNYSEFGEPDTPFFILGLAPNAARISIRFFHRSTLAELIGKLHDHQSCFEMVRQFTEQTGDRYPDPEFPAIWQILRQIRILHRSEDDGKIKWKEGKEGNDKFISLTGGALARSIIEGANYPETLFSSIIRRINAEKEINYLRAATLKAILVRNHKETIPIMLDQRNTDPAYLLGRLFATLERTQEDALGELNSGLRDKFYGSASATPASVFPRILRTYQHHLAKMQSGSLAERIGMEKAIRAKINRERLVQEIVSSVDSSGFPNHLSLKNQGIFAIGYYHQRKDFFTKKETTETESPAESATIPA